MSKTIGKVKVSFERKVRLASGCFGYLDLLYIEYDGKYFWNTYFANKEESMLSAFRKSKEVVRWRLRDLVKRKEGK